jgi:lipooligosaccharide transport system permease protein
VSGTKGKSKQTSNGKPGFVSNISSLSWTVWKRNRDVYLKTYNTNLLPPLLEPILYLLAFGFGLGAIVSTNVDGVRYIQFIAPAMVALSVMNAGSFECTYGSYVRMYYQKTFDAITATPVSVEDVIAGEMLWGATKSVINAGIMVGVMLVLGPILQIQLLSAYLAVLILVVAFIGGLLFSAIAMCFTAVVPTMDHFNYYMFLIITPMMLLCGTFFPTGMLPQTLQTIIYLLPLTHVVIVSRELAIDRLTFASAFSLLYLVVMSLVLFLLAIYLMRRRLIK